MDEALPTPDLSQLPAEMRRPLTADLIHARRPGSVAWGVWSFGLTWILMLVVLLPFLASRLRRLPQFSLVELLPVAAALAIGGCLLVQVGLLHGRLSCWIAAMNLCLVPVVWAGYWAVSFLRIHVAVPDLVQTIGLDLAAGSSALFTLILLFRPASRRWFWRASVLRSQVRRWSAESSTPRLP